MSELALLAPQLMPIPLRHGEVKYRAVWNVPVPLAVRVALPGVTLQRVMQLQVNDVLLSDAATSNEVALFTGDMVLGWGEFEVADHAIGICLTRLGKR